MSRKNAAAVISGDAAAVAMKVRHPWLVALSVVVSSAISWVLWRWLPGFIDSMNIMLLGYSELLLPAWLHATLQMFFSIYIWGSLFPFILFTILSFLPRKAEREAVSPPFVSIIIPSFNEEANIARCIESALAIDYPEYEVIVVDDGSLDLTLPIIENYNVSCIRLRSNRGKSAAVNLGLERAKGEIVFFTDSDSSLDPMVLRYLTAAFSDPSIGAVAGKVLLKKSDTYLQKMQSIEYLYGQAVVKEAQFRSGYSVSICPGPVTAFRKDVLLRVGGFRTRTLAEDFDVTLELLEHGFQTAYEPRAVAYTSAMTSWRGLKKQRIRWSRGHLQVYRQHRETLFTGRTGLLSLFWLPYALFIGYGSAFLEMVFLAVFPSIVIFSSMPLTFLKYGFVYMLVMECITAMQGMISVLQSGHAKPSLLLATFLTQPYRIFLSYTRIVAFIYEIQNRKTTW
ncbi:glucosaminyltransferase [Prosthecochloris sp. GSB1]|uniref:glycosyltransferase n=1 Tax=Prosthecochloris sp. GSB1 TaxID=281093 RepID=UPI000B8CB092|nr:glycosyltransferase [Prosthecochloris sp. GSB1]ASQ91658.1 glucosaminyltransferase [Prosthecochloris sp. GSB1]